MPKYRINPTRSQVWMEAQSSIHPIHGEAKGLEGEIVVEITDGRLDLSSQPTMRIELPIDALKSGNALQDREMQKRVDARRYPRIIGESKDVTPLGNANRYRVRGDLTFHGVTRPVDGEVELSIPDERTIVFEGSQTFDIREYGVTPPKILMLRVHPEVKVRVRVVGERQD